MRCEWYLRWVQQLVQLLGFVIDFVGLELLDNRYRRLILRSDEMVVDQHVF